MRLLFVHQYLGALGGAETTLLLTASELKSRGHDVSLLYGRSTGKGEQECNEVFSPHCFRLAGPGNLEHAEAVLAHFRPDALFFHNVEDLDLFELLLQWPLPKVRMLHDHSLYCMRQYKYNYFTRAVCQRPASAHCVFPCLGIITRNDEGPWPVKFASYSRKLREIELNRKCDRFFVYSDYCRQELVRNGFDAARVFQYAPVRLSTKGIHALAPNQRNLLIYAGQIIRGKGVDVLLKALSKVQAPFECLIIGDGSHRAHCEGLARKLKLTNRVRFTGFLPRQELQKHYLDATAFLVSSVWPEPFGLVGPEAMQFGLPVIAFDAGGIKEWLHHNENGFLVPWMDTEAYAAAVERLLRDKALARTMGARGRERVARDYDVDVQIAGVENVFADLLKAEQQSVLNQ